MSLLVSSTALQLHTEEEHQVVLVHIEKVHMYISHRVFTYNITQVVYYNYTGVEFLFTYMLIYLNGNYMCEYPTVRHVAL